MIAQLLDVHYPLLTHFNYLIYFILLIDRHYLHFFSYSTLSMYTNFIFSFMVFQIIFISPLPS